MDKVNKKKDIKNYTLEELERELKKINIQKYRAEQIFYWLYSRNIKQFDDMINIPKKEGHKTRLPLILWNHRWEYDKNPEEFFALLYQLDQAGLDFQVAVLGECFAQKPEIFLEAREILKGKIVHFGYVDNFIDYASWLWKADIIPVTSRHDFFGASVVQALYCNCYPLLPKRFSYAEHLPDDTHSRFFYNDFDDLMKRATDLLMNIQSVRQEKTQGFVTKYDWQTMADIYDKTLEAIL